MECSKSLDILRSLSRAYVLNIHNFMLKSRQDSDKSWTYEKLSFGRRYGLSKGFWATCETEGLCDLVWKLGDHLVLRAESENSWQYKHMVEDTIKSKLVDFARDRPSIQMLFAIVYPKPNKGETWDELEKRLRRDVNNVCRVLPNSTLLAVQADAMWAFANRRQEGWPLSTDIFSKTGLLERIPAREAVEVKTGFFYGYLLCRKCENSGSPLLEPRKRGATLYLRCRQCGDEQPLDIEGYEYRFPHPLFPQLHPTRLPSNGPDRS